MHRKVKPFFSMLSQAWRLEEETFKLFQQKAVSVRVAMLAALFLLPVPPEEKH